MTKSNMLLQIEARTESIWNELNELKDTDPEVFDILLMSPADVQQALDNIEDAPVIAQLKKELQQVIDTITNAAIPYEAVCYEWSYDSYDIENPAIGKAYEKYSYNSLSNASAGPGNSWVSMTNNKPVLSGQKMDLNRLSVYLITRVWYELIASSEEKYEEITNDMYDNMPMVLFDELFKLKLFTLLDAAYSTVTGKKPDYFSVGIYGHWHTEITEYRIEAAPMPAGSTFIL